MKCVIRRYQERIEKWEKRRENASEEQLLAIENHLAFLRHGYQEYLSEKKHFL